MPIFIIHEAIRQQKMNTGNLGTVRSKMGRTLGTGGNWDRAMTSFCGLWRGEKKQTANAAVFGQLHICNLPSSRFHIFTSFGGDCSPILLFLDTNCTAACKNILDHPQCWHL